ncbi:unnamed protein product [Ilex paraguariensis]|uniref:Cytochrome P450 n=1 Tax=Ilex paraguariensis TaxID=185542 RepID=A0ABC8S2E6_9AQUA
MGPEAILFLLQPSFFCIFPLLFLITFLFKWLSTTPTTHRNLPPSPPKLPIIRNLHQLGLYPHRSLQSLARQHGPLMLLCFGSVKVLVASSIDATHEIMKTHDRIFSNRPRSSIPSTLLYNFKDIAFAPYGEYWRQVKSIAVLQLLSHKRVQSFRKVREEETDLLIEKIREALSSSSLINFSNMFMLLTNDVVCRVALGRKYSVGDVFNVGDCIPWLG